MINEPWRRRMQRTTASFLLVGILVGGWHLPARAVSTQSEIRQSIALNRELLLKQDVVSDPLLQGWVNRVAHRVWRGVHRTDIPYTVNILDTHDVNAFTIGGGFIYLNRGLLDTVGSDDELAGVLGHETGHDEHRHPITQRQRGELLSLLFGLAALASPIAAGLGPIAEAGILAKSSRVDEEQADDTGLALMTAAGYDADAMPLFMRRLLALEGGDDNPVDRYTADHPALPLRIDRLTHAIARRDEEHRLVSLRSETVHDLQEARYAVAEARENQLLAIAPNDPELHLLRGLTEIRLARPTRAFADLTVSTQSKTPNQRRRAHDALQLLEQDARIDADRPSLDIAPLRRLALIPISDGGATSLAATPLRSRLTDHLAALTARLTSISDRLATRESATEASGTSHPTLGELSAFERRINTTLDRLTPLPDALGTLENGRSSGLLADQRELARDVANLLIDDATAPSARALLPAIPTMSTTLTASDRDVLTALTAANTTLTQLDRCLDAFDRLLNGETMSQTIAEHALDAAFSESDIANRAFNRARSRLLEVRISLLNVGAFADRYEGLRFACDEKLPGTTPTFAAVAQRAATTGEVVAARILAAATHRSVESILDEAMQKREPVLDLPIAARVDPQTVEIFLGLIYLDYADDVGVATAKTHDERGAS